MAHHLWVGTGSLQLSKLSATENKLRSCRPIYQTKFSQTDFLNARTGLARPDDSIFTWEADSVQRCLYADLRDRLRTKLILERDGIPARVPRNTRCRLVGYLHIMMLTRMTAQALEKRGATARLRRWCSPSGVPVG